MLQNVSDSRLLEMANQYITTDESLEKFQARLREKYNKISSDRNDYMMIVENSLKEKMRTNKSFNQAQFSSNNLTQSNTPSHLSKKAQTQNKNSLLSKNIATALEYYDKIQA